MLFRKKDAIKPLRRSITTGFIFFIISLCLFLGISTHLNYKRSLFERYNSYIIDILNYVETSIDHKDLENCIHTLERSQKFDELEKMMDGIKEDFRIHYLYIIKPLNKNPTGNVMSVLSAENYYDRYINTEGNLYLGWISEDEFGEGNVEKFFEIMKHREPVFFEEKTEWGYDYTGALTLFNPEGRAYAILAVDVDISTLKKHMRTQSISLFVLIVILGSLFTLLFLFWTETNITKPIKMLCVSAVSFVQKSHGQRDINQLKFNAPKLNTRNEILELSNAITQMTQDMQNYVEEIVWAELDAQLLKSQATQMKELANTDALTGLRNKTSYDKEMLKIEYEIDTHKIDSFGIAMIDLNFLKKINDTYGHEKGDLAIKNLSSLICNIFQHSPVFRIGGDEFVVILKDHDLEVIDSLLQQFNQKLESLKYDDNLELWEKVSAAIGTAIYDTSIDESIENVFKRADKKMYDRKVEMKAHRVD